MSKVDVPLAETFTRLLRKTAVGDRARFIRDKLISLNTDLGLTVVKTEAQGDLLDYQIKVIEKTQDHLEVLATEEFRQRTAIKHFLHGKITLEALRHISESWNGDDA